MVQRSRSSIGSRERGARSPITPCSLLRAPSFAERSMAGGGGAWKVAYADFVTAMMAFFLVMWITSQNADVKKAIGGYFQDPWGSFSENTTPTTKTPAGLKGDAPFADTATGILPNRF